MAECPFCSGQVDEDLITFGGPCPKCFGHIPGEEAATDPGEEVKAALDAQLRRKSALRTMIPILLLVPVVMCAGLGAFYLQFLRSEPELALLDFDELDEYYVPEIVAVDGFVSGQGGDGVASAGSADRAGGQATRSAGGSTGDGAVGGTRRAGGSADANRGSGSAGGSASAGGRVAGSAGAAGSAGSGSGARSGGATAGSGVGSDGSVRPRLGQVPSDIGQGGASARDLGGQGDAVAVADDGLRGRSGAPGLGGPAALEASSGSGSQQSGLNFGLDMTANRRAATLEDPTEIRDMIGQRMSAQIQSLNQCYERQLKTDEDLAGKWRIKYTVQRDGTVVNAGASGLNMRNPAFEACMVQLIERWRFGRINADQPVQRTVNFTSR